MDIYLFCLGLGFAGLLAMALLGLGHHGHDGAHAGHAHGHADLAHGHIGHGHDVHAGHGHDASHDTAHDNSHHDTKSTFWAWLSPRAIFSMMMGFGATGTLLQNVPAQSVLLSPPLVLAAAVGGGIGFERLIVLPIWNFLFRFASNPARTLESAVLEEARAVTDFDDSGCGLIALNLDGQIMQVLGRLRPDERADGTRVRTGDVLLVEAVDAQRNSCTVSLVRTKQ